tara:strand:- start:1371 stop:1823 length:453 start_codon:yes stop_codon:yes gene_type:complete
MGIFLTIIAILIAGIALYFQIKGYLKKNRISKFQGRIGNDENDGFKTSKLSDFVLKNEGKIIFLDIYFDNDYKYEIDNEGIFRFSYFYDSNEKLNGGYEYLIKVKDSDDFFYDNRWSSRRLKGYFKVIGFSGPQMGWFSTIMKPVNIESV